MQRFAVEVSVLRGERSATETDAIAHGSSDERSSVLSGIGCAGRKAKVREMTAIIKTWPAGMRPRRVIEAFTHDWGRFYFTIGRGKPKQKIDELFYTHRGLILGHFRISEIVQNAGQLPKLRSISGETSEWQIKPDSWVAICDPPFHSLKERLFYESFRGFRYFDLAAHRGSMESKVRIA